MSVAPEADQEFLKHLGQYLGLLTVDYVILAKEGKDVGEPKQEACSGFFAVLDGRWYFVTAGHVFHRSSGARVGLKQAVDAKAIRVTRASIADYFGPGAKPYGSGAAETHLPTIIDFDEVLASAVFVNDEVRGLDFAFVPLRDFYVEGVKANGVSPITEEMWQPDSGAVMYVLVGFPDEEKTPSATDYSEEKTVRPCFARMYRCDLPDHLPKPTLPYLAATLPPDGPVSPVGFSGSPIFGVRIDAQEDRTYYSLAAIDHEWHRDERIIVGCLMTSVVDEFKKLLAAS